MPEETDVKPKSNTGAIIAVAAISVVVAAMLIFKESKAPQEPAPAAVKAGACCPEGVPAPQPPVKTEAQPVAAPEAKAKTPRLLDLGAGKCIPCKAMAPILEDLKKTYEGRLTVDFVDVWERQDEAAKHKIAMIPTQIFFDADGKELFRHEGFYSKEDILSKWKELGFEFQGR